MSFVVLKRKKAFAFWAGILLTFLQLNIACGSIAFAGEKNAFTVNWSPNLFTIAVEDKALDATVQQRIVEMLSQRFHSLRDQKKLPFMLKEVNEEYNIQKIGMDGAVGLIALVVDQNTIDSKYQVKHDTYYKSLVLCGIDVMFCSVDEETNSMRILHTIPLRGYDIIGGDVYHPVTAPITEAQKCEKFLQIAKALIYEDLSFEHVKEVLKNVEVNQVLPETYQVTEVEISSPMAKKVFQDKLPQIKGLIGGVFTSKYQQAQQRIVYPSLAGGTWEKDASRNLYSLQMSSPSSAMTLTMDIAKYPIKLDLTGLASHEITTKNPSTVKYDMGYKAWLKKTPVYGKEQTELTKVTTRQFSKQNTIQLNEDDIFTELLIGLTAELAAQKE